MSETGSEGRGREPKPKTIFNTPRNPSETLRIVICWIFVDTIDSAAHISCISPSIWRIGFALFLSNMLRVITAVYYLSLQPSLRLPRARGRENSAHQKGAGAVMGRTGIIGRLKSGVSHFAQPPTKAAYFIW